MACQAGHARVSRRMWRREMKNLYRTLITTIALFGLSAIVLRGLAQQQPSPAPAAVDAATRTAVITGAIEHMKRAYIFEDVAGRMAEAIQARVARKEYDAVTAPQEFADLLTRQLQEVSHDKHLRIVFNPEGLPQRSGPTAEERARALADERRRNFGFERVERLDGNVGYIELRGFSGSLDSRRAAVAAMNLVADTDALIFDLRRNGGGSPFMIGILSSYLFNDVVHLNDFYVRENNSRQQFFTTLSVEGRRYGEDKPVYVLTSNRTFSAAEEFTYNLKTLQRATIVGETTGGGAHPGGVRRITDHFGIWLPTGRAINPITRTNWEGTGIEPHIKVDAAAAQTAAHLDALKKIRNATPDPRQRELLDRLIGGLEK
jgi:retinol-binding protein 3